VTLALPSLDDGAIDRVTGQSGYEHVASFLGSCGFGAVSDSQIGIYATEATLAAPSSMAPDTTAYASVQASS